MPARISHPMNKPMTCEPCRSEKPYLMSCIHTFAPATKSGGAVDRDVREEAKEMTSVLRSLTNRE